MVNNRKRAFLRERDIFFSNGGVLKTAEAIRLGIHPRKLYAMAQEQLIQKLGRGLFRLSELQPPAQPDLLPIAMKVSNGVICLVSALLFHGLTNQIPQEVAIAIPKGSEPPRLEFPPTCIHWFSGLAYSEGIESHIVDGATLKVYCPEKTIADCFKFRAKVGMETCLEALKRLVPNQKFRINELSRFAKICKVERVMFPYVEALL